VDRPISRARLRRATAIWLPSEKRSASSLLGRLHELTDLQIRVLRLETHRDRRSLGAPEQEQRCRRRCER